MGMRDLVVKQAMLAFGLDENSSLVDVVEVANDMLNLGLSISDVAVSSEAATSAVLGIGKAAAAVVQSGVGKFFSVEANPEGKGRIRAFVVIG